MATCFCILGDTARVARETWDVFGDRRRITGLCHAVVTLARWTVGLARTRMIPMGQCVAQRFFMQRGQQCSTNILPSVIRYSPAPCHDKHMQWLAGTDLQFLWQFVWDDTQLPMLQPVSLWVHSWCLILSYFPSFFRLFPHYLLPVLGMLCLDHGWRWGVTLLRFVRNISPPSHSSARLVHYLYSTYLILYYSIVCFCFAFFTLHFLVHTCAL